MRIPRRVKNYRNQADSRRGHVRRRLIQRWCDRHPQELDYGQT